MGPSTYIDDVAKEIGYKICLFLALVDMLFCKVEPSDQL